MGCLGGKHTALSNKPDEKGALTTTGEAGGVVQSKGAFGAVQPGE